MQLQTNKINTLEQHKYVRVMFDWESSGIWDLNGSNVEIEDATNNKYLKELIKYWHVTQNIREPEEDLNSAAGMVFQRYHMEMAKKIAYFLKEEHPDWKVVFYNNSYFKESANLIKDSYHNLEVRDWRSI